MSATEVKPKPQERYDAVCRERCKLCRVQGPINGTHLVAGPVVNAWMRCTAPTPLEWGWYRTRSQAKAERDCARLNRRTNADHGN